MRKLARTLAVVALSAGTISMLAVVPARASTTPTPQRYPICKRVRRQEEKQQQGAAE